MKCKHSRRSQSQDPRLIFKTRRHTLKPRLRKEEHGATSRKHGRLGSSGRGEKLRPPGLRNLSDESDLLWLSAPLPAASSPFVSALCPPPRPQWTPARTDVDSCSQPPSSAPGHPTYWKHAGRQAGGLSEGDPARPAFPAAAEAWPPRALHLPGALAWSCPLGAPTVHGGPSSLLFGGWLHLGLLVPWRASCVTPRVGLHLKWWDGALDLVAFSLKR